MLLENELHISLFVATLWFSEKAFAKVMLSPVITNMIIGMILGPPLLNIVPSPDGFALLGRIGLMLLVLEAGLGIELEQLMAVGLRAFLMGITGALAPVLLVVGLMPIVFKSTPVKESLSIGAAVGPTSVAFSVQLLKEFNLLETSSGVLICTAAMVDDVFSLGFLGVILAQQDPTPWNLAEPVLGLMASVFIGAVLTVMLSRFSILQRVPKKLRGWIGLSLALALSLLLGYVAALLKSSDLLGCFMVGVAFSREEDVKAVWQKEVKTFANWGSRLFFASTIGFSIPTIEEKFFQTGSLQRLPLIIAAAFVGKLVTGIFARPLTARCFCMIGFAMCGRGDFSFLIASKASDEKLISTPEYCSTILALLVVCFLSPLGLRLSRPKKPTERDRSSDELLESTATNCSYLLQ